MWPELAGGVILPLHEAILGRTTFSILASLSRDLPDRRVIEALEVSGLRGTLEHASRNIPYWKTRLEGRLAPVIDGDPTSLLGEVPVLTRAEIRRERERLRWVDAPGKVLLHRSGGTTDDNLTFYWGRDRQSWDRAMRIRALERFGIFAGEPQLHVWPRFPQPGFSGFVKGVLRTLRDRVTNDVAYDPGAFSSAAMARTLARLRRLGTVLLVGYPSWLFRLAEHIRDHTPNFKAPTLRRILSTGEVIFPFQRQLIEQMFAAPVIEEYGSQDCGCIAHEGPDGHLWLNAEQMAVEIFRDGRRAKPGELGEVIVTNFHSKVMPFIRYATGDVARQAPVGSTRDPLLYLSRVEGRTSDILVTTDGELVPLREIVQTLHERTRTTEFSFHQTRVEAITCLTIDDKGGITPDLHATVEDVLRGFLGKRLEIEWRVGSAFRPLKSGKRRYACSSVALDRLAHDRESGASQARAWPEMLTEVA